MAEHSTKKTRYNALNALDSVSRQAAIDAFTCNGSVFTYGDKVCKAIVSRIMQLPSAQPDWNEMIVICDCCGHAIHVKRQ